MVSIVRRIVRGLRYSEHYGSHPGTPVLIFLLFLGACAGGLLGLLVMLAVFGPIYLVGAWERGK